MLWCYLKYEKIPSLVVSASHLVESATWRKSARTRRQTRRRWHPVLATSRAGPASPAYIGSAFGSEWVGSTNYNDVQSPYVQASSPVFKFTAGGGETLYGREAEQSQVGELAR